MSNKRGTRIQNMRKYTLWKMTKELAMRLGKNPKNYTTKSFRWSAAAQLAEAGISVVGLQMAGNWESATIAIEYVKH